MPSNRNLSLREEALKYGESVGFSFRDDSGDVLNAAAYNYERSTLREAIKCALLPPKQCSIGARVISPENEIYPLGDKTREMEHLPIGKMFHVTSIHYFADGTWAVGFNNIQGMFPVDSLTLIP